MKVRIDTFGALSVRPMEDLAGAQRATRARDVDLRRGKLHPLKSPSVESDFTPGAQHKTIYFFDCGAGDWRSWPGHVPVAPAPLNPWDRTGARRWYYAEGGKLKVLACRNGQLVEREAGLVPPTGVPDVGVRPYFEIPKLTVFYDGQSSFDPDELLAAMENPPAPGGGSGGNGQPAPDPYKFVRKELVCNLESMEVDGAFLVLRFRRPGKLRALNMRRAGGGLWKSDIPAPRYGYVLKYDQGCSASAGDPYELSSGGALVDAGRPNPNPASLELRALAFAQNMVGAVGTIYTSLPRELYVDRMYRPALAEGLRWPDQYNEAMPEGARIVSGVGWVEPAILEFRLRVSWNASVASSRVVRYRFAYVDDIGQLSGGGKPSKITTVPPGHVAVVSNFDAAHVGAPADWEQLRLYRARWERVSEARAAQWWLIAAREKDGGWLPPEMAGMVAGGAPYCDNTTGEMVYGGLHDFRGDDGFEAARDLAPREGPPPEGIEGLVTHAGGFLVAIARKGEAVGPDISPVLRFSEVGHVNHWPPDWVGQTVDRPVALEVAGNDLVVGTAGRPEVWYGTHPERMTGSRLPFDEPCISAQGMCAVDGRVCYPSLNGLCAISGGSLSVVTQRDLLPEQWRALALENVAAVAWEGRWLSGISFAAGEGVIVEPGTGATVTHTVAATAFHYQARTAAVWCAWAAEPEYPGGTDRWVAGMWGRGEARELVWRSALFLFAARAHWTALRVRAQEYPVRAVVLFHRRRVWGADDLDGDALDRAMRVPLKVMDGRAFRLPGALAPMDHFALELRSTGAVMEVGVGTSPQELHGVP